MVEVCVNGCDSLYKQFTFVGAKDSAWEYKKHLVKNLGFKAGDVEITSYSWEVEDLSDNTSIYFQTLEGACQALITFAKMYNRDNFTIHECWN